MIAIRRLAAIMAIDVVGYSRLMGEDEAGTAKAVREHRDAVTPLVVRKGGRVVKTMGDGLLLEFPSVVAAVECAIAIQKLMIARNADTPEDKRIVYRIGINLGDILIEGDDILGDGVNVAARIEGLCEPGGVLISGSAYDQVRGRLEAAFFDLGLKAMKNIAEPVRVYAVDIGAPAAARPKHAAPPATLKTRRGELALFALAAILLLAVGVGAWRYVGARQAVAEAAPTLTPPTRLSIVVLPFSNLSGDASQDYLVDALVDELTTYVSRIPDTFVIARNSAFTYKGKAVDIKQVGREMGIRYALEGSVQLTTTRIRVNAQLIDAETGAHLWAETFDEERADLLQMEDDIVTRLARSLDVELTAVEALKAGFKRIGAPDARELALQCLVAHNAGSPFSTDFGKLGALYAPCERTIDLDPLNLVALHALVDLQATRSITLLHDAGFDAETNRLDRLAALALSHDPDNPRAHRIKAILGFIHGRFYESFLESERALAINPSDMGAYNGLVSNGSKIGQAAKSIEYADKAVRLSPRDPYLPGILLNKAIALLVLGRYTEALALLDNFVAAVPNSAIGWRYRVLALAVLARTGEAHEAYLRYAALPVKKIETLAEYRDYIERNLRTDDPAWSSFIKSVPEAMKSAGMPEQ